MRISPEYLDLDESLDDESLDGNWDESAEFLGLLGPIAGGVASGIGSLASGIGGVASGIGNVLTGGPPRPRLPGLQLSTGGGVSSATINTPAGAATIALPTAVVRQDEYKTTTERLQDGINRNTSRLNTIGDDMQKLRRDFTSIETDTRNHIVKLRADAKESLAKAHKHNAAILARIRREQSQQQMTSMMMTMMMQRQVQDTISNHTHPFDAVNDKILPSTDTDTGDNSSMMFLPMMMMGSGGDTSSGNGNGNGGDSNNMMMMMVMMMMSANQ